MKKAGESGAAEVAMGKLGTTKATDTDVKVFAQHMVKDHTQANQELMAAANGRKKLESKLGKGERSARDE